VGALPRWKPKEEHEMKATRATTRPDPKKLSESDLDNERMGRNRLQGDHQRSVRNERQTQPEERQQADDMEESFRKVDKDARARLDLGKGSTRKYDD
jgi:hypothetical protein